MQPDNQNNYWKKDSNESGSDKITDMYTPTPVSDEPTIDNLIPHKVIIDNGPVHWSAVEYINGEKSGLWFTLFGLIVLTLIAIDVLFLHAYTFSVLIIVMTISVVVFSRRPARTINYTLSGDQGLYIGEKLYHFSEFKSFGLVRDHNQHSLILIPIKRFSPGVSVYFPEEVGEKIVDILGTRLPMENLKLDIIDLVVQKLRL